MIELVVNGVPYTDYTDVRLTVSMQTVANDFSFTATAVKGFPPFKLGDSVQVNVHNEQRLNGYIEEISGNDNEGNHQVTYSGRDRTADFIDSAVNEFHDIRPPITLKGILERIIGNVGSDITVVDDVSPAEFNKALDVVSFDDGTQCLDVAFTYMRKRQCLLSSNEDGNLNIIRAEPIVTGEKLQKIAGGDNNIMAQSWDMSTTGQYNQHIFKAQLDTRSVNEAGSTSPENVVNQSAIVTDDLQRTGRQRVQVQSESFSRAELKDLATWDKQMAKASATRFNCTTKGHLTPTGQQWQVNTLVMINSDSADIQRHMLLNEINYTQSEGSPSACNLSFVERDVYTIDEKITSKNDEGRLNESFK